MISTFLFYLPITYLNYQFDELIKKFRIGIKWNNENAIYQIIKSYDELIDVVNQLSPIFNMIIGLAYCVFPYIVAIELQTIKIDREDFVYNMLKKAILLAFVISNIHVFIINQLSASITVRNISIPQYLYPIFCSPRFRKIQIKLKIDSFIARLNTQFIGFYCFNLFEFDKMIFYQYILVVSSCYFLVSDFLKKLNY